MTDRSNISSESFDNDIFRERRKRHDAVELSDLISRWVMSERRRYVIKRDIVDDVPVERIAEEIDRSPRQTARILRRAKEELFDHI